MTVLFKPILALHIINFSSCRNYWGGGGGNDMFAPQYFNWGRLPPQPPPPPDRRLWGWSIYPDLRPGSRASLRALEALGFYHHLQKFKTTINMGVYSFNTLYLIFSWNNYVLLVLAVIIDIKEVLWTNNDCSIIIFCQGMSCMTFDIHVQQLMQNK